MEGSPFYGSAPPAAPSPGGLPGAMQVYRGEEPSVHISGLAAGGVYQFRVQVSPLTGHAATLAYLPTPWLPAHWKDSGCEACYSMVNSRKGAPCYAAYCCPKH